jgi:mannose-6-phosphate isomerase-like protein (cupin superfamily)
MSEPGWARYGDLPVDDEFEYGTRHLVSEFFGSAHAAISVVRFEPGESGPLQVHHEPVEEYYLVLEGVLEVRLGDEVVTAEAGTVLFVPPGTAHRPTNDSNEPATLFSFVTPDVPLDDHTDYLEE